MTSRAFDRLLYRPPAQLYHWLRLRVARTAVDEALLQQEQAQWLSPSELERLVDRRVAALLRHAGSSVPYYREVFAESGVDPDTVTGIEDLERLPLLDRDTVSSRREDLVVSGIDTGSLRRNATGGSTGQPVEFYQDAAYQTATAAALRRSEHMCGYQFPQLRIMLWGADRDRPPRSRRMRDLLLRRTLWIDAFGTDEAALAEALGRCETLQPELAVAYASFIALCARFSRSTGIGSGWRPNAIQTSAELLTARDRQLIEDTYGAPVFDRYGCREAGNIAHECDAHEGLHVLSDVNHVEIIVDGRKAPPGTPGEIVVTNLTNLSMPLIRYRTGDIGVLSPTCCPCGRGLPLMSTVLGRSSDMIVGPSGGVHHGEVFSHVFYGRRGVRRFRVEQVSESELKVLIEPSESFDRAMLAELESALLREVDAGFAIRFVVCDELPTTPTGKHRFTVSHLPPTRSGLTAENRPGRLRRSRHR